MRFALCILYTHLKDLDIIITIDTCLTFNRLEMCFEKHNSHYDVVIGGCVRVVMRACDFMSKCVCACVRVCDLCLSFNLYFKLKGSMLSLFFCN